MMITYLVATVIGCKNDIPEPPPKGPDWIVYTHENTPALPINKINALTVDGGGRVWFGTDSGAVSVLRNSWGAIKDSLTYLEYSSGAQFRRKIVNTLAEGKDGSLWFGLNGGGVRRYNRNSSFAVWQRYSSSDFPQTITYDYITSIGAVKFQRGDIWIATLFGVSHFTPSETNPDQGVWETVPSDKFPGSFVRAIGINPMDNTVCFGTERGAAFFDEATGWNTYDFPPTYSSPVLSVTFDLSNTVWLAKRDGVTSFNRTTAVERHYTYANTNGKLPTGFINAVTTDLFSTRWFGTEAGLIRLHDTTWTTFNHSNSPLPNDTVTALSYDKRGNLWIGTLNGIAVFNETGTSF